MGRSYDPDVRLGYRSVMALAERDLYQQRSAPSSSRHSRRCLLQDTHPTWPLFPFCWYCPVGFADISDSRVGIGQSIPPFPDVLAKGQLNAEPVEKRLFFLGQGLPVGKFELGSPGIRSLKSSIRD
jgi:hypothetical protein